MSVLKTFRYQSRVLFLFALVLFLFVTFLHLKKKVDHAAYVEHIQTH